MLAQHVLHHQTPQPCPALWSYLCGGGRGFPDNTLPTSYSHALGKHAVALLGRFNKGALIAKLDLQAAFPMVPVLASKWELLGMHWHDNYYVDTCLPFSLLAPTILTTLPVPSTGDYFLIYCTQVEGCTTQCMLIKKL